MLFTAYIGSNNVAHRISKAYIGDSNGKAKTFYEPEKVGVIDSTKSTLSSLASGNCDGAVVTHGNYAIYAGGCNTVYYNPYGGSSNVECYTESLTKSTATALTNGRTNLAGTTIGNYALFAGGAYTSNSNTTPYNTVDTYTKSLVKGTADDLSSSSPGYAYTLGGYAVFGSRDRYDASLVKSTYNNIVSGSTICITDKYILAASSYSPFYVRYLNSNFVTGTCDNLTCSVKYNSIAVSYNGGYIKGYAIYGCAKDTYVSSNPGNYYTDNLVHGTCTNPHPYISSTSAIGSLYSYLMFFGGFCSGQSNSTYATQVHSIDTNLVVQSHDGFGSSQYMVRSKCTAIGDYILHFGGQDSSSNSLYDCVYAWHFIHTGYK